MRGSISEVIKPILRLTDAHHDQELQKLLAYSTNVFMTRNWDSHEFSVTVSEYQHAVDSLIQVCCIVQRHLEDATLAQGFVKCVAELRACMDAIDCLQTGAIGQSATICSLRLDQVTCGAAACI
jgi:hypothetical protein